MKTKKYLQYDGKEVILDYLEKRVKDIWKEDGKLQKDIKQLELYIKVEENRCYYVINEIFSGSFELIA